jgi:uncharacterized tellurite resistance protein B-like protein
MREFERFCGNLERMSKVGLDAAIARDATRTLAGLRRLSGGDPGRALALLVGAAMAAASVDGRLHPDEYRHVNCLVSNAAGRECTCTYEEIVALVEGTVDLDGDDRDEVRAIYVALVEVDGDAAASFICFLTEIMVADGDATWKEKKWLKAVFDRSGTCDYLGSFNPGQEPYLPGEGVVHRTYHQHALVQDQVLLQYPDAPHHVQLRHRHRVRLGSRGLADVVQDPVHLRAGHAAQGG